MPTERRKFRIAQAIHRRQPDLAVALDGVHDSHNLSAIMRSSDATGVSKVIWSPDPNSIRQVNPEVSKGTERWVELVVVDDLVQSLLEHQQAGYSVAATHMGRESVDFRTIDWTKPWIVVMGNEQRGCSGNVCSISDANIFLPMLGLVQSLNVSVATAVILYEIQCQRELKGMYSRQLQRSDVEKIFSSWHLEEEQFQLEDLIVPPDGSIPDYDFEHLYSVGTKKSKKRL